MTTFFESPDILIANAMIFAKTIDSVNTIDYKFIELYTKKVNDYLKNKGISMIVTYGEGDEPSDDFERGEKYIKCYCSIDYLLKKYRAPLPSELQKAMNCADDYFAY